MEETFLYTVNPRKVIVGISGVNAIRTSKSLFLTKEDVLLCLKNATVYRRFAAEGINERVTVGNIDRVHRKDYVSEADWAKVQAQEMSKAHGTVTEPVVETKPVVEEPKKEESIQEPIPAQVTEPISDAEEKVEEVVPVEDEVVEKTEETAVEENETEESDEVEAVTEPTKQNNNNNQFKYNKKKNK